MSKLLTNNPRSISKLLLHTSKMPAFTLYGARGSTNTDRVRLTLAEGGFTDYDLVLLNLHKGEQKVNADAISCENDYRIHIANAAATQSEENMKRHPWGKIPAITFPSGFTLYESRAICKYLAKKYSFALLPSDSDVEAAALFDQAQSVEMQYFAEPAGKIGFEKFVKKFMGLPTDEAVVSDALRAVNVFFDVAERLLRDREYMAGKDFSLVDIYYIPLIRRLFACGYGDVVLSRDAVSAWWNRCVDRPAIQKMLAADEEAAAAARR
jgi:glutathione S-transferase